MSTKTKKPTAKKKEAVANLSFNSSEEKMIRRTMDKTGNGIAISFRSFCKWAILRFCQQSDEK